MEKCIFGGTFSGMFTGIIEATGEIKDRRDAGGSVFVSVAIPKEWELKLGESVAINGVCSTVKRSVGARFTVEYMPETLRKTTATAWQAGETVNLERALALGDRLSGHMVQGHVDTVGTVLDKLKDGESFVFKIKVPQEYIKFIAQKGSITVDGVSLTVVLVSESWFSVSIVDYTLRHTIFANLQKGDKVNIETDVLAKYIEKLLQAQ